MVYKNYISWFERYEEDLLDAFEDSNEKDWKSFVNSAFNEYVASSEE